MIYLLNNCVYMTETHHFSHNLFNVKVRILVFLIKVPNLGVTVKLLK